MHVPSAYLNVELKETVYMKIDKELAKVLIELDENYTRYLRADGNIVVKLKKNLYGLRQSGKNWYEEIRAFLKKAGYEQGVTDPCTFIKRNVNDKKMFSLMGLYVDDLLLFGTDV